MITATVLRDSIIDPLALTFEGGRFGTIINGQTFQYPAILTANSWQYATWFDAQKQVAVGRRRLPDGPWQIIRFDDYRIAHTDVHNVSVIGICPLDGTLHLAFDHHCHPLHYRISEPGLTTSPDQFEWSADQFSPITSELMPGQPLEKVTYPEFFLAPDQRLQLYFRIGHSGNGHSHLATYDPRRGGWHHLGEFTHGAGHYRDSDSRNAYHNGFDYGPDQRLHTTWTWREGKDNNTRQLLNCHDLMYAFSDDAGLTWRNNDCQIIGRTGSQSITLDSPGVTVQRLPYQWGIMNQVTQTVDARGRLHVVMWMQPLDAPAGTSDMNSWRYLHFHREHAGQWHRAQLPFAGRKPTLHADRDDNLYLVFNKGESAEYHQSDPGGILHIARATHAAAWSDWQIIWRSDQRFSGEPRVDPSRWADQNILSVYVQEHPSVPGHPSALHAIDFQFNA